MHAELARHGLKLSKEHSLSNMPRGYQNYSDKSFSEWLKLNSFVLSKRLDQSDCITPQLVQTIVDFAVAAKPLFDFGWHVEQTVKPEQHRAER